MPEDTQPTSSDQKPIADVEQPGTSAPSATSKPVLVGNRPLLKDPMVVDDEKTDDQGQAEKPAKEQRLSSADQIKLKPSENAPRPDTADEKSGPKLPTEGEVAKPNKTETADNESPTASPPHKKQAEAAAAEAKLKHQATIQKLVDSREYALPVNTVEERRSRQFIVLGAVLTVVLILAWIDIALDAHIISLGGLHPVTHFFSN